VYPFPPLGEDQSDTGAAASLGERKLLGNGSQGVKARYEYPPLSGVVSSGNDCVEEEVNCGDPAIASNDKVGPGIGRCLARPA
jgi:hypothetical protein